MKSYGKVIHSALPQITRLQTEEGGFVRGLQGKRYQAPYKLYGLVWWPIKSPHGREQLPQAENSLQENRVPLQRPEVTVNFAMEKKNDAPSKKVKVVKSPEEKEVVKSPVKVVKHPRKVELERLAKTRARLDKEFHHLVKSRAEKENMVKCLEAVVLQKKINLEHKTKVLVQARLDLAALEREVERDEEGVEVAVESLVHGRECLEKVQQEMETNKTIVAETRAKQAALVPPKAVPKLPKPVPTQRKEEGGMEEKVPVKKVVMPAVDLRERLKGATTPATPNPTTPPSGQEVKETEESESSQEVKDPGTPVVVAAPGTSGTQSQDQAGQVTTPSKERATNPLSLTWTLEPNWDFTIPRSVPEFQRRLGYHPEDVSQPEGAYWNHMLFKMRTDRRVCTEKLYGMCWSWWTRNVARPADLRRGGWPPVVTSPPPKVTQQEVEEVMPVQEELLIDLGVGDWNEEVELQEVRDRIEEITQTVDEQGNMVHGDLPQPHGDFMLFPHNPTEEQLKAPVLEPVLQWIEDRGQETVDQIEEEMQEEYVTLRDVLAVVDPSRIPGEEGGLEEPSQEVKEQ